jgi:hypothetical protein
MININEVFTYVKATMDLYNKFNIFRLNKISKTQHEKRVELLEILIEETNIIVRQVFIFFVVIIVIKIIDEIISERDKK